MKYQKGFTLWAVVTLISIIAIGLVGATWYYKENKNEGTVLANITSETNKNIKSLSDVVPCTIGVLPCVAHK